MAKVVLKVGIAKPWGTRPGRGLKNTAFSYLPGKTLPLPLNRKVQSLNFASFAGLSRSQIEAVLREYGAALAFILTQGDKILTPLFNITPTVSGVFTDRHDRFDRNRHGINLKVKAGVEIQKVADLIVPEKITGNKPAPLIDSFFDKGSQITDERLTPGRMARISGLNLKFDETDPQQGIFLIQRDNKKETQVPVGDILDNTGGTLTFQVPDKLPKGTYTVEVRSTMKGKILRTGQYQDTLAVV